MTGPKTGGRSVDIYRASGAKPIYKVERITSLEGELVDQDIIRKHGDYYQPPDVC